MSERAEPRGARKGRKAEGSEPVRPGEERFEWLLGKAATLIASKGFHHMSMRDVSRTTGYSLAGLYHYVDSKEDLLFEIQQRFFSTLVQEQAAIRASNGPVEDRLRSLMENHLAFFAKHADELKVCTFELHSLTGEPFERVAVIRRRYFGLMADVVKEIVRAGGGRAAESKVRHQTMFVFGALNWIFMWYEEKRDGSPARLAENLSEFILHGLQGAKRDGAEAPKRKIRSESRAGDGV